MSKTILTTVARKEREDVSLSLYIDALGQP